MLERRPGVVHVRQRTVSAARPRRSLIGETIAGDGRGGVRPLASGSLRAAAHASAIATRCASVGWLSRSTCAHAGGSGSPSDVFANPTKSPRTAAGSRVVWSAFQSASDSMPPADPALRGRGASWSAATTRSASGIAAASPIPPRRRVGSHQDPRAGKCEEPEPGERLRDVVARVVPDLVGEHRAHLAVRERAVDHRAPEDDLPRRRRSRPRRRSPGSSCRSRPPRRWGCPTTPCFRSNSVADRCRAGSSSGVVSARRYGCANANPAPMTTNTAAPGIHHASPSLRARNMTMSSVTQIDVKAAGELEPAAERPLEVSDLAQVVASRPPDARAVRTGAARARRSRARACRGASPCRSGRRPTRERSEGRGGRRPRASRRARSARAPRRSRKKRSTCSARRTSAFAEDGCGVDPDRRKVGRARRCEEGARRTRPRRRRRPRRGRPDAAARLRPPRSRSGAGAGSVERKLELHVTRPVADAPAPRTDSAR